MFKFILTLLLIVILISVLRSVIGVLMKGLATFINSGSQTNSGPRPSPPPSQLGGDLHRDPVCGTFVAETTAYQRRVSGQTFYYCSEACKGKHALVAR